MYLFTADMTTIICDSMKKVTSLLTQKSEMPTLKLVVLIGTPSEEDTKKCDDAGVEIISFEELLKLGKDNPTDVKVC